MAMGEGICWEDARLFLSVAREGSFSAAALSLKVGQATVSRRVAALEEQLGCALFHRGRRGTSLTPQGERLLPGVEQMARWAAEVEAMVAGEEQEVAGVVTIATPSGMAHDLLLECVAKLREQYPALRLALAVGNEFLDLTRGEADLAVRTRPPHEPALVSVAQREVRLGVYASSAYLARLPSTPVSIAALDWIAWAKPHTHAFPNAQLEALIPQFVPVMASNDYLVQMRACELGLGAMVLPDEARVLAPRGLVRVPVIERDFDALRGQFHLVCTRSMRHVPRVAAVIEGIVAMLDPRAA